MLKRTYFLIMLWFCAAFAGMAGVNAGQETAPNMHGSILINIKYFGPKFIEFTFQDGKLVKGAEGEVIYGRKEGRYTGVNVEWSDHFKAAYNPDRRYHYQKEDELAAIMGQYDMEEINNIRYRLMKNKVMLENERFILTKADKKSQITSRYSFYFLPN